MADHWRRQRGLAETLDIDKPETAIYATGWALSGLGTLAAVLIAWHFGI